MMMPKSATIPGHIGWDKTSMAGPKRGILDDEAYSSLGLGPEAIFHSEMRRTIDRATKARGSVHAFLEAPIVIW